MSDENIPSDGTPAVDPFKNFKSEIDRKLGNFESQVSELTKANQALLAQLSASSKPATKVEVDDIATDWYDNPAKAAAKIKEAAKAELRQELAASKAQDGKTAQVLNQLVYDYPELQSNDNELTRRATAIYMGMDAEDKKSPIAYKLAVKDAAAELGIQPRAKRSSSDDSYSPSGSSSGSSSQSTPRVKKGKLAPETVAFAKLVGMNTDDAKVIERLEKRQRDNWTKYR